MTLTVTSAWAAGPPCTRAVTLRRCKPTSDALGARVIRAVVVPFPSYRYARLANEGGGAMRPVPLGSNSDAAASPNAAGPEPVALASTRATPP